MQEHRHYQIDNAHQVSLLHIVLKGIAAVLFMVAFYSITSAQNYTFTGAEDDRFENPANWTPAYPGAQIAAGAVVFVEGNARLNETLILDGTLHIAVGSMLKAEDKAIIIMRSGKLTNDGELFAASLRNHGTLNNNFSATLALGHYVSYAGSATSNLMNAEMLVNGNLVNGGTFNNYSTCIVESKLENTAAFYQMQGSDLQVNGAKPAAFSYND